MFVWTIKYFFINHIVVAKLNKIFYFFFSIFFFVYYLNEKYILLRKLVPKNFSFISKSINYRTSFNVSSKKRKKIIIPKFLNIVTYTNYNFSQYKDTNYAFTPIHRINSGT